LNDFLKLCLPFLFEFLELDFFSYWWKVLLGLIEAWDGTKIYFLTFSDDWGFFWGFFSFFHLGYFILNLFSNCFNVITSNNDRISSNFFSFSFF
jgi:hypothetical protein